jgi:serine/threonine protein kinase
VVGKKFKLAKKIGQGAFGDVFSALNLEKNTYCAVKFEKVGIRKEILAMEMETMSYFRNTPHFPNLYYYGKFKQYKFLVMDLLGVSILFVLFLMIIQLFV